MTLADGPDTERRVLQALKDARLRLEADERARHEPIAILGLGCRFPGGADSPAAFWELLRAGRDGHGELPRDRWDPPAPYDPDPDAPGAIYVRHGHFLADVAGFDPQLFGISPREARVMDPQHRLLLEVTHEAIEHAGLDPRALAAAPTGVFVGITANDYARVIAPGPGLGAVDSYFIRGNHLNAAAGRIAHVLDLHGPALAVDTACSSSLVALHLACRALRAGDCRQALVGGVSLVLAPEILVALCKSRMLARDGRCKTFDAAADGFGVGEGCGVVLLKRHSDALADGDRILALVRATTVNNDGATSGFTVPSGPAQAALLRRALHDARLGPGDIDHVEVHGTGTALGDPIELQALGEVFQAERPHPLLLGSVKTNLGHLAACAGLAGVIKTVLALQHRAWPRHLHFTRPNPQVAWDRLPLAVAQDPQPWSDRAAPRRAGVSSFGASGTNAHAILEEAPPDPRAPSTLPRPLDPAAVRPRSARTAPDDASTLLRPLDPAAVRPRSARTAPDESTLPRPLDPAAVRPRSDRTAPDESTLPRPLDPSTLPPEVPAPPLPVVLSAADPTALRQLAARWAAALATTPAAALASVARTANEGRARHRHRVAFVVDELAALRRGLNAFARTAAGDARVAPPSPPRVAFVLRDTPVPAAPIATDEPEFHAAWERCTAGFTRLGLSSLDGPPARFALQYALGCLWRAWGVVPAALLGVGAGEVAAACLAGALQLEDALGIVAAHTRRPDAPHRDPAWPAPRPLAAPELPLVAGDGPVTPERLQDPTRWGLRRTRGALSDDLLRAPPLDRCELWLELGADRPAPLDPHAPAQPEEPVARPEVLPSLRGEGPPRAELLHTLTALYLRGVEIDFAALHRAHPAPRLDLPTYPFQRRRFWHETAGRAAPHAPPTEHPRPGAEPTRPGAEPTPDHPRPGAEPTPEHPRPGAELTPEHPRPGAELTPEHPLLGAAVDSPLPGRRHHAVVRATSPAFLADHAVFDAPVFPASAYLEIALAAAGPGRAVVAASFLRALWLPRDADLHLHTVLGSRHAATADDETGLAVVRATADDETGLEVFSATADGHQRHVEARLAPAADPPAPLDLPALLARHPLLRGPDEHYRRYAASGVQYGPAFRLVRAVHRAPYSAVAHVEAGERAAGPYRFHPAILDACLQAIAAALPDDAPAATHIPVHLERLDLHAPLPATLYSHALLTPTPHGLRADLRIVDPHGRALADLRGLALQTVTREALTATRPAARTTPSTPAAALPHTYELIWQPRPATRRSADDLPDPARLAATVDVTRDQHDPALARHVVLLAALDRLATAHVAAAVRALGGLPAPGHATRSAELLDRWGVQPRHRPLAQHLLTLLRADGLAHDRDDAWSAAPDRDNAWSAAPDRDNAWSAAPDRDDAWSAAPDRDNAWSAAPDRDNAGSAALRDVDPRALTRALRREHPEGVGEIDLVDRCGEALPEVLTGRRDPLPLLFPGGDVDALAALYGDAPGSRYMNALVAQAARGLAPPAHRRLRAVEIGAGTGATTAAVLSALTAVDYTFTDISPRFLARARARFPDAALRCQVLDIERDPTAQGLAAHGFDLVVAANVLHATADLDATLAHVRRLLAPGGLLLLLESTAPRRWVDLTFGLSDGWWRFRDRRRAHPLLPAADWAPLLAAHDLHACTPLAASDPRVRDALQQTLMIARAGGVERARRVLVVADEHGPGAPLCASLSDRGHSCIRVPIPAPGDRAHPSTNRSDEATFTTPTSAPLATPTTAPLPTPTSAPLADVARHGPFDDVILLQRPHAPFPTRSPEAQAEVAARHCDAALELLRARASLGPAPRLHVVTVGAAAVGAAGPDDPAQASLGGLTRSARLELPDAQVRCIDLEPGRSPAQHAEDLRAELLTDDGEDHVALRGPLRLVARLRPLAPQRATPTPPRPDGAYLISGGLSGLGLRCAQHLAAHGARHLVLLGRRPPGPAAARALADLAAAGVRVDTHALDIADGPRVRAVFSALRAADIPVRGVLHAAGALADAGLQRQDHARLRAVFRAKIEGAWLLHQCTEGLALERFVLFSSAAGVLGSAGQANHAAANAFLDALAGYRRARGLPALSVAWGPWSELGAAVDREALAHLAARGIAALTPADGLAILDRLIAQGTTHAMVAAIDWPRLRAAWFASPLFAACDPALPPDLTLPLAPTSTVPATAARAPTPTLPATAARAPTPTLPLVETVTALVARVLAWPDDLPLPRDRGFFDLGLDSLTALELANLLRRELGLELPETLLYRLPTIDALTRHLTGLLAARAPGPTPAPAFASPAHAAPARDPASPAHAAPARDPASPAHDAPARDPASPAHDAPAPAFASPAHDAPAFASPAHAAARGPASSDPASPQALADLDEAELLRLLRAELAEIRAEAHP